MSSKVNLLISKLANKKLKPVWRTLDGASHYKIQPIRCNALVWTVVGHFGIPAPHPLYWPFDDKRLWRRYFEMVLETDDTPLVLIWTDNEKQNCQQHCFEEPQSSVMKSVHTAEPRIVGFCNCQWITFPTHLNFLTHYVFSWFIAISYAPTRTLKRQKTGLFIF